MLTKLVEVPQFHGLVPFVRSVYASPTRYAWEDEHGACWEVAQHEGGEHGDPLMPLLFFVRSEATPLARGALLRVPR